MATVLTVISDALKELGVLAAGEVATDAEATDAMGSLNQLLDQWAAERLSIYSIVRTLATLTASTASFTVGTGGNVNIARPVFIDHINYVDTSQDPDLELPLNKLTDDMWAGIPQKALTSTLPTSYFYNPTYPTGTLYPWPIPTSATLQWAVYAPTAVTQFTALTDAISLPPGYWRMLVKNLALDLAPAYSKQVSPALVGEARDTVATVKRANKRLADLSFPASALIQGAGQAWSIRTGP